MEKSECQVKNSLFTGLYRDTRKMPNELQREQEPKPFITSVNVPPNVLVLNPFMSFVYAKTISRQAGIAQ
jgi:hypothetical protein